MDQDTLVINPGSSVIQFGTSYNDTPTLRIPAMIGRPKHIPHTIFHREEFICRVGEELYNHPFRYDDFTSIISNGIVQDWDDMINLLEHCLYKIPNFSMTDKTLTRNVVLTEHLFNPTKNRQKWFEVLFEYFDMQTLVTPPQCLTALLASGRTTGLVLDIGEDCTQILPIYEGYVLSNVMNKMRFGGSDLTNYVAGQLAQVGINWEGDLKYQSGWEFTNSGRYISRKIKENLCYVSLDYSKELEMANSGSSLSRTYELPDKTTLTIDDLRFKCGEVLFRPSEFLGVGFAEDGVDDLLINTLLKSPTDCRSDFYKNILLCGGSVLMNGLEERLKVELQKRLLPPSLPSPEVKIIKQPDSRELSWIGGAVMGSLGIIRNSLFSKNDYLESGRNIMNRPFSLT